MFPARAEAAADGAPAGFPGHAFTVDVEDWFHILDCPQCPALADYERFPSRVVDNTRKVLDLLSAARVPATFFVLGWVAERHPALVREIAAAGHELASHGFEHTLATELAPRALEADIRRSIAAVADACGSVPVAYRSPGGSLTTGHEWVFDLLLDLGLRFDASLYPRRGGLLERSGYPAAPFVIRERGGRRLWEFPSVVRRWLGRPWAFGEGGYFRLLPYRLIAAWTRECAREGRPASVCIHPRELDPHHPRLALAPAKRLRTYVALGGTRAKLQRYLREFEFVTMGTVLDRLEAAAAAPPGARR